MAISISNIASKAAAAYTKIKSSTDYEKAGSASLIEFITKLHDYGTLINSKYEVSFSGIEDITFFITGLNIPSIKRNFTSLRYEGKIVEIPQTIEFEHDFNMTFINDGEGKLYSTVSNWLMTAGGDSLIDSGFSMIIRHLGDGQNDAGITYTMNGVRFKTISGPTLNYSNNEVSTFELGCSAINYTVTQGKLTKVAGIAGAVKDVANAILGSGSGKGAYDMNDWLGGN